MDDKLTLILFLVAPPLAGELLLLFLLFRATRVSAKNLGGKRIVLFNLCSLVLLVILSFAGGELYYRFVYDTTDSVAYTKVSQQWGKRYIVVNSAGFRDNVQYALPVAPGKRRVSFLGDSFTAGHGVKSVEDRFPNLLRAKHPEWEVHVLARVGWDTGKELEELEKYRKSGYQFGTVVLVYCLNDVADLFPEWSKALEQIQADAKRGGWLRRNSFFLDILYHRRIAATNPYVKNYYAFVRQGYAGHKWQIQRQRLTALKQLVESNGGKFAVVTFPFLQSLGTNYEYDAVHDELNRFWKELGVPNLDLRATFAGVPPERLIVNAYDPHPNELANSLAATAIEQFLSAQLQSNTSPALLP
ncbi:MAG TPA: SGNH/GDSL hydrolase family protein [Verrucomicrobiae bacterium]|nr:SGNH/GDSL hydrolase family protein [Verrucomicrobiae bacterium]